MRGKRAKVLVVGFKNASKNINRNVMHLGVYAIWQH